MSVHVLKAYSRVHETPQGLLYATGVSAEACASQGISMHLVVLPPLAEAVAHYHEHETAIYILEGSVDTYFGEDLHEIVRANRGDFVFIPAGEIHKPVNPSSDMTSTCVVARTCATENEPTILVSPAS